MHTKQMVSLLVGLLFLLACSLLQSPAPKPTPAQSAAISPSTPSSADVTATPEIVYELFDESPAPDQFTVVRVGNTKEKLLDILRVEAMKATDLGRKPFVEFYADWCPPCNAIRKNLGDPRMVDAFAGTYIIKLDLDYWKNNLSGTGLYVPGIPAFYELDAEGKPTGRMITGAAWAEDVPENIAPPMKNFFNGGNSQ